MVWKSYVFVKNFQKAEVKTKNYYLLFWKHSFVYFYHLHGFLTSLFTACVLPNIKIFLVYEQKFFEVFDISTTNLLNIVF